MANSLYKGHLSIVAMHHRDRNACCTTCLERPPVFSGHIFCFPRVPLIDRFYCTFDNIMDLTYKVEHQGELYILKTLIIHYRADYLCNIMLRRLYKFSYTIYVLDSFNTKPNTDLNAKPNHKRHLKPYRNPNPEIAGANFGTLSICSW